MRIKQHYTKSKIRLQKLDYLIDVAESSKPQPEIPIVYNEDRSDEYVHPYEKTAVVLVNGFNGMSDINLLSGTSSLAAFAMDTIRLTINLQPKGYTGTVNNVAVITATTPYGGINMNSSSQSFANETSKTPTPSVIPDLKIDIRSIQSLG